MMARPLRIEYKGALYHITARGNERRKIYFTKADYEKFLGYVKDAKEKYGINIHAYVLMTNHYHLIIETPEANLSKAMHHINSSYTTYINKKRKRSGHLFQGRYKAIVVGRDSYLVELSRYIHLNPVRAGIEEKPEEYPYSSYRYYITKEKKDILNSDLILGMLSQRKSEAKKKYRKYVEIAIGEAQESPLKEVYGGMILGSNRFIKETLKKLKREYLQRREISHRRALRSAYGIEEITDMVSEYYKASKEEITTGNKRHEQRNIAIYLIKGHTDATNPMIGERFGGLSYSAVAKINERLKKQMNDDRKLRRKINKIEGQLSQVKG